MVWVGIVAVEFHRANVPAPPRRRAMPAAPAIEPLTSLFMMASFFTGGCGFRRVLVSGLPSGPGDPSGRLSPTNEIAVSALGGTRGLQNPVWVAPGRGAKQARKRIKALIKGGTGVVRTPVSSLWTTRVRIVGDLPSREVPRS